MKIIEHKPEPQPSTYTLELTADEMVRLGLITYRHEVGHDPRFVSRMPDDIQERVMEADREYRKSPHGAMGDLPVHLTWVGEWK